MMKAVKILMITLSVFLIIGAGMAYFYAKAFIQAPPNAISSIEGDETNVNILWDGQEGNDRQAMLLPVRLAGIPLDLYMQFDLGAQYSVLYDKPIASLENLYPGNIALQQPYSPTFTLGLGGLRILYDSIRTINYGKEVDNVGSRIIIGTIGADMIERLKVLIDFEHSKVFFSKNSIAMANKAALHDFGFENRRMMIDVNHNGESKTFMWDTGASGYGIITSKKIFEEMTKNADNIIKDDANQLHRKLQVYTAPTDGYLTIGGQSIPVKSVSYVSGFPWYVEWAFGLTGMEGMIGNELFRSNRLYIDAANEKFAILPSRFVE